MNCGVFVVGSLHLDMVVEVPHLPEMDETILGSGLSHRLGGKGGNQAVSASLNGANVEMAGIVGNDQYGLQLLDALSNFGVNCQQIWKVAGNSGFSFATINKNGDYTAVVVSGVNSEIDSEKISVPKSTKVLLLQNEIPEIVNLNVIQKLNDSSIVVLNAAPSRPIPEELLEKIDILVVNLVESFFLSKIKYDNPLDMATKLVKLGAKSVVVTLGKDGFVFADDKGKSFHRSAPKVKVESTHGAGDFFIGATAAKLSLGIGIFDALEYALSAAALFVSTSPANRNLLNVDRITEMIRNGYSS